MTVFFWVIVTCHAQWSECDRAVQPNLQLCMQQAEQINLNTDGIAICTIRSSNVVNAPDEWAITTEGSTP